MSNKKMIATKKYGYLLLSWLCTFLLNAQVLSQISTIESNNNISVEKMSNDASGNLLYAGLFDGSFEVDGNIVQSNGENDIYISKRSGETLVWTKTFGSIGQDEILALTHDNENNIYVAGSYLDSIRMETVVLTPKTGVRGHFIAKLSPLGALIWVKDVNSSGEQVIGEIVVDNSFNVYICGYFGGILQMDSIEMTANANSDLMVLQFSENGVLQQAYQAGISGNIWGRSITINSNNNRISVSGVFRGVVDFDGEMIQTNTNDFDVFVAQFNEQLEIQWARKAGGVYEDNNSKILTDDFDNVYVIGDFQGVIRMDENIEITTMGVQDNNLYILKYDKDGTPLLARSLGGSNIDITMDAVWSNTNQIAVIGSYQDRTNMENFDLVSEGFYNMYTVGISSENGHVEWLEGLGSNNLILGNSLANTNGQLVVGGSFLGSIVDGDEEVEYANLFNGYLKYYDLLLTPTLTLIQQPTIQIYPNPASNILYIQYPDKEHRYQVDLYSISGHLIKSYIHPNLIDLQPFQNGMYYLLFRTETMINFTHELMIQR